MQIEQAEFVKVIVKCLALRLYKNRQRPRTDRLKDSVTKDRDIIHFEFRAWLYWRMVHKPMRIIAYIIQSLKSLATTGNHKHKLSLNHLSHLTNCGVGKIWLLLSRYSTVVVTTAQQAGTRPAPLKNRLQLRFVSL